MQTGHQADPQGAVVAGARVVITNQGTNISTDTTANGEGYYTITSLKPGLYTIQITQAGFRTDSRKDIELNVGQKDRFDFQLSVGEASAVVDITSDNQSLIQREDAIIGSVVDNRRITQLPLLQIKRDLLLSVATAGLNEINFLNPVFSGSHQFVCSLNIFSSKPATTLSCLRLFHKSIDCL